MGKKSVNKISSEVLAAFLDGNATTRESKEILNALSEDTELRELLHISQLVDSDLCIEPQKCEYIPMTALAANCEENNYCSLECEKYILRKLNVEFDEEQLLQNAIKNGWLKENGTALHNVGRHLEDKGLAVTRQYKSTIEDIAQALQTNRSIMVAVDGGELLGNAIEEYIEDTYVGCIPDHVVVVLSCDIHNNVITIYDPNSSKTEDTYSITQFKNAWNDSKNYLVTINTKDMSTYNPKPIDLSDVELSEDLNELREAIAENAHDIWAVERQSQGWTYGPNRDDAKKETPCMVAYSELPESEKVFDRDMAMNTLKLVRKLGYDLIKREETDLYKDLLARIRESKETYYCPQCWAKKIKTPVSKHQIFCHVCGHNLDLEYLYKEL